MAPFLLLHMHPAAHAGQSLLFRRSVRIHRKSIWGRNCFFCVLRKKRGRFRINCYCRLSSVYVCKMRKRLVLERFLLLNYSNEFRLVCDCAYMLFIIKLNCVILFQADLEPLSGKFMSYSTIWMMEIWIKKWMLQKEIFHIYPKASSGSFLVSIESVKT